MIIPTFQVARNKLLGDRNIYPGPKAKLPAEGAKIRNAATCDHKQSKGLTERPKSERRCGWRTTTTSVARREEAAGRRRSEAEAREEPRKWVAKSRPFLKKALIFS